MINKHYALVGGKVFTGTEFVYSTVLIAGNTIIDLLPVASVVPASVEIIAVSNLIITAGFIDLQLNGCGGVLFNDAIEEATLDTMYKTCLRFGCTSFLPTLITASESDIVKAIAVATKCYKKNPYCILGIHLEGPYISKVKKGIHNSNLIKPLDQTITDFLCKAVKDIPIKITLAPEVNDSSLIQQLIKAGVWVSLGHTNANYEEAIAIINSGASFATHLFNAMSGFEGRNPNVVGAVLNSNIYSGIIMDGHHVSYPAIQIAKKIKQDKLFIVTDAVTPMGTDLQQFTFAQQTIYVKEGKCVNAGGTLAGANIDMLASVKNAVLCANIPIAEALRMVNLYPAKALGIADILGKVEIGKIANLAIFNEDTWQNEYSIAQGVLHTYK